VWIQDNGTRLLFFHSVQLPLLLEFLSEVRPRAAIAAAWYVPDLCPPRSQIQLLSQPLVADPDTLAPATVIRRLSVLTNAAHCMVEAMRDWEEGLVRCQQLGASVVLIGGSGSGVC
jgi:hypothetical protein